MLNTLERWGILLHSFKIKGVYPFFPPLLNTLLYYHKINFFTYFFLKIFGPMALYQVGFGLTKKWTFIPYFKGLGSFGWMGGKVGG